MRIRKKRLALVSSSDRRSEAAPPPEPSDQTMPAANKTGVFPKDEEKEFGDIQTLRSMETTNEIRKIVTSLHPQLSSVQVVPLKKRGLKRKITKMKRESEGGKKRERGGVVMEGSRCSRVNRRGWRCGQPTLVGYSLCQHHLGKGSPRRGGAPPEEEEEKKEKPVKARSMRSLLSQI